MSVSSFGDSTPMVFGDVKKLSWLPVIVGLVLLLISAALILVGRAWPLPLVAWALTPFGVVICLGLARLRSIRQSSDPWFDRADARRKMLILQVMTLLSFLVSFPHVWRIGQEVALWLQ